MSDEDGWIVLIVLIIDGWVLYCKIMLIVCKWNDGLFVCLFDSEC